MLLLLRVLWVICELYSWYGLGWVWLHLMLITSIAVKLAELDWSGEMIKYHSLVQSVEQYIVTLLSVLWNCRLNVDVCHVVTSGISIHLCKGILWPYWDTKWEILLCLFRSYQLIGQHLEWLNTTQVVVSVLVLMLVHVGNMTKLLFHYCLLNLPFWHEFVRPHGIQQMLKWESWYAGHVSVMLSFMLYLNIGLN